MSRSISLEMLGHARLGVTVGRRGVAIDGAEVAVAVDEHIAHGEVLRQTHQRVVDRRVAVGMVAAQHVADAGGGFFEGLVVRQTVLIHGVEDAAVDGLEAVAHVGQSAADDDGHGVLDVGATSFHATSSLVTIFCSGKRMSSGL